MRSTLRALPPGEGVPVSDPLISDSQTAVPAGFVGGAPPRACEWAGYSAVLLEITGCPVTASERKIPMSKVIFVTGAGRGLGTDIAREALAAGHQVVATGRRPEEIEKILGGPQDDLLVIKLDVTSTEDAQDAAQAAVDRFGA